MSAVPRLRRVAQALSMGHRAGQVVGASEEALLALFESSAGSAAAAGPATAPAAVAAEDLPGLLRLVKVFDGERLTRLFLADWARLGPVEFLESRIAPLVRAVGEGWQKGELEIRHEHFLSERIGDLLRSLRLPIEERSTGPLVVHATLAGESHDLGLQMSALVLAAAGCRGLFLGADVPVPQIASLARDIGARAVAVSVSLATKGPGTAAALRKLRETLPRRTLLVVGGEGAPSARTGIDVITDLRELDGWGRRLAAGLPVPAHPEV